MSRKGEIHLVNGCKLRSTGKREGRPSNHLTRDGGKEKIKGLQTPPLLRKDKVMVVLPSSSLEEKSTKGGGLRRYSCQISSSTLRVFINAVTDEKGDGTQ